jgi:hypothetical protein
MIRRHKCRRLETRRSGLSRIRGRDQDDEYEILRGTNKDEYEIYLSCANDGQGGDITRPGHSLKTFDEWLGY